MKTLIYPLITLAATGTLLAACYAPESELAAAGTGDAVPMTVGLASVGATTDTNKPYVYVAYSDGETRFQVRQSRTIPYATYDYYADIHSDTPAHVASAPIRGAGVWTLFATDHDVKIRNNDFYRGNVQSGTNNNYSKFEIVHGIHSQAAIGARTNETVVILGRKIRTDNGVAHSDSAPGLMLITQKRTQSGPSSEPTMATESSQGLGSRTSVNPNLALDPASKGYIASWMNSESEDVSASFVDASGKTQAFEHSQPGSPKAGWTNGQKFRIASVDKQGMSYLFDGSNLVDGPNVSSALCSAFAIGEDGTLSVLTVSDAAVTLSQHPQGAAATSVRLAGAVGPESEIKRSSICALSSSGVQSHAAWQSTVSLTADGENVAPITLTSSVENGQIVATHALRSVVETKVKFKIALPGAGLGEVDIQYKPSNYASPYVTCLHPDVPGSSSYQDCDKIELETVVGSTVTLTARPHSDASGFAGWSAGSQFGEWGSVCQGTSPTCTFVINQSTTVGVVFKAPPLSIGIVGSTGPGGTVTSQPAGIDCNTNGRGTYAAPYGTCSKDFAVGTQVVLTAVPQPYMAFLGWGGTPGCNDASLSCTVTITDEPLKIMPGFVHITKTVTIEKIGTGAGAVTSASSVNYTPISCGTECTLNIKVGAKRDLVASPAPGSQFSGWINCPAVLSGDGRTCQVSYSDSTTTPAPLTVTATFNTIP